MNLSDEDRSIIEHTIFLEGGYVNDPADAGGETKFGISKRQYPSLDIKNLTKDQAVEIYARDYFNRMNLASIPSAAVRKKLFDIGVNMGTGTAIRLLQQVVGVKEDGALGDDTIRALGQMEAAAVVIALQRKQVLRYADICIKTPSNLVFLKGWVNRAYSC